VREDIDDPDGYEPIECNPVRKQRATSGGLEYLRAGKRKSTPAGRRGRKMFLFVISLF
jgi:hypothetical protein